MLPHDLVQAQRGWNDTYRALALPRLPGNTALRRRLLRLSVRLWWHAYWRTTRSVPTARMQLRQTARTGDTVRTA
ncbi:hypothetical protein J7E89_38065 [Streptomyces sp. ISL-100]|nr:hypothetical protein [Streptomyces sp. ISL-100]MBT2401583.1 hypothetical protein [Streptomyces sp. ISL-100]